MVLIEHNMNTFFELESALVKHLVSFDRLSVAKEYCFVTSRIKLPQVILSIVVNETFTPKSSKMRDVRRVTLNEFIRGFI